MEQVDEPQTCDDCIWSVCNYNKAFEDEPQTCEECEHWNDTEDGCADRHGCKDEPQRETKTETQNSNLTFKTLEYCDICDHKGCEECVANALDEHCMPSQFKKQIEDECAKEYEEIGLKELKELIEADRKAEPNCSEKPNNCDTCRNKGFEGCEQPCLGCGCCGLYEPKDEPQTYKPTCNGECRNCEYRAKDGNYCMKTDCAWR